MNVTCVPGVTGLPLLSVRVAVIVVELLPSAGMVVGLAVRVMPAEPPVTAT